MAQQGPRPDRRKFLTGVVAAGAASAASAVTPAARAAELTSRPTRILPENREKNRVRIQKIPERIAISLFLSIL